MKILGVIPARYGSTRFPGKPLADILGKPMIWWVYRQAKKAKKLTDLVVATDDKRITDVCDQYKIPWIMTQTTHQTAANRLYEVSTSQEFDYYIQINGDEPLMDPNWIDAVVLRDIPSDIEFGVGLVTKISNPIEVIDPSNIKVVFDNNYNTLYMSRSPIPYPFKSLEYNYYKHIGVIGYNKKMLKLYHDTKPGVTEKIEGIDSLRFNDYAKQFKSIEVPPCDSLSVDTPKDLETIITRIKQKFKKGELDEFTIIL